jgi:hypothetical protein
MVETRRRKKKDQKRVARVAKHADKLKKQSTKEAGAGAAKGVNP